MIKVLFLDLDETLVAQEQAFTASYRQTASWLVSRAANGADVETLAQQIPIAAQRALASSPLRDPVRRCCFGGRDLLWGHPGPSQNACLSGTDSETRNITRHISEFRKAVWAGLAGTGDSSFEAEEISAFFRKAMFDNLTLFPDVLPTLKLWSERFRIALISNGMSGAQFDKLEHLEVSQYFETLFSSADIGAGKPDPLIFSSALNQMAVEASEALMLGDALLADVRGAQAVGMKAVWLNRHDSKKAEGAAQISSLLDSRAIEQTLA